MPQRSTYRVLSLDGGGIRGLITAVWLKKLEERLNGPLYEHFDLIAGTSTGAILACGVSKGLSAARIIALYRDQGKTVFPGAASRLWSRATRLFTEGASAPKYDGKGLEAVLKEVFHTTQFQSLKIKPTLITSYDTLGREPVVFKNHRGEYSNLRVWEICKASSSAPTYFPGHVMQLGGADVPLIDGGVVANNPTACAIAEAKRFNRDRTDGIKFDVDDFLIASFGTGEATRRIEIRETQEWGAAEWAIPIVDVLFDGSADSVHYIAGQLLKPENYFRFQVTLTDAYDDMDNADRTNLNALIRIAEQYLASGVGKQRLDSLVERLNETN